MKAYKREITRPVLSIGMIVKNEQENLPRCLDSLQPLMDAVSCELIIADTGSTDATVEIAKRYTDQVFHFDWINDFSAARNSTVEKATGEWYMYMDADNWFVDLEDMIAFFTDEKLRAKYNCASYTVRNYVGTNMEEYEITHDMRIVRRTAKTRFYGRIHEHLLFLDPYYEFKSLTYHTGYVSKAGKSNKADRNIPLLVQAIEAGDDEQQHLLFQLGREYTSLHQFEKALEYFHKGIDMGNLEPSYFALIHDAALAHFNLSHWEKAAELCQIFLREADKGALFMDMQFVLGRSLLMLEDYVNACPAFASYTELYEAYVAEKLDTTDTLWCPVAFDQYAAYLNARAYYACCLAKCNRYAEALVVFEDKWNGETVTALRELYDLELECVLKTGDVTHYWRRYQALVGTKSLPMLKGYIDSLIEKNHAIGVKLLEEFASHPEAKDDFCRFLRLRANLDNVELLTELLANVEPHVGYAKLIGYAMKKDMNFLPYIERVDSDDLSAYINEICATSEEILAYYKKNNVPMFPCALRWKCALLERALFENQNDPTAWEEPFSMLRESLAELVTWIYGEEMPSEELLPVIPRAHRFGIFSREAARWEKEGDVVGALRMMGRAGEAYPVYLQFVQTLLDRQKKELDRLQAIEDEARSIEGVIKQKIRYMIHQGDLKNAQVALDGYANLRPNDPDLEDLRMQVAPAGVPS